MKVCRYFPAFFEGFTAEEAEVSSLEELHAVPFLKKRMECIEFSRFSISLATDHAAYLMCEKIDGTYFVIATLIDCESFFKLLPPFVS